MSTNHLRAGAISSHIRSLLRDYRSRSTKVSDGPQHWAVYPDAHIRPAGLRGIIGVPTRGCSYARTPWGGCAVCGHTSSTLWNPDLDHTTILEDVTRSLLSLSHYKPSTIGIYTSGSFFDDSELNATTRQEILSLVSNTSWVHELVFESLPYFLTPECLKALLLLRPSIRVLIGMGLDSSDAFVRSLCFQRHIPTTCYSSAVRECLKHNVNTIAYIVHGAPFLTPAEAIADTTRSISDAFTLGFNSVSIEPVAMQPGTLQSLLAAHNLYDRPTLWAIGAILSNIQPSSYLSRVTLGGNVFTPLPTATLSGCRRCITLIHRHVPDIPTSFFDDVTIAEHGPNCGSHDSVRSSLDTVRDRAIDQVAVVERAELAIRQVAEVLEPRPGIITLLTA